jgi:23S rRNA (uracil1939-C5)-methyltransferase
MQAYEFINNLIPPLKVTDNTQKALAWMEEIRINVLPVVDDTQFKGLITDEEAKIKITSIRKSFGQAIVIEILKRSDNRVSHPQSILGSCDLLHLSIEEQNKWQSRITKETLKKILGEDHELEPIITDFKDKHYRNKSVFHVMDRPYLTLGLYHKDQMRLVEISEFILADQKTNEILKHLNFNKIICDTKVFKHLVVRTNLSGEALVTLVATKKGFKGLDKIVQSLMKLEKIVGITVNISTNKNVILGNESLTILGENIIVEPLNGADITINDRSFFQINLPVIQKVYDIIKSEIKPKSTLIDAYSGVGSIGYYLADKVSKVTMIESNKESYEMALSIKEKHRFDHVEIINDLAEHALMELTADYLIVDPPRNGLMPELLEELIHSNFKKIFYVSCDAKTLSRDLVQLTESYSISHIYPIKMFYHTTSLETLVILTLMD